MNHGQMIGNSMKEQAAQQWCATDQKMVAMACAEKVRDKPLMDVEYDQLEQATLELDQSVQWLLQRIQPICQPAQLGKAIEGSSSREPDAPESHMRTKLKNLRGLVESISGRISEVRYTIEI